ncbi:tripartite tricarboxylate transporter TctB family protein [Desmospora activa]|uniref:Tripartite tricarboxylate transporter TctB family protein n=1 Tax=Desmospora activa DSM 45169 TaxID=1121389 RepID=A0A2T4Z946_9BACL|nr:tripartite tricarboxylate transporter TctB family protein [Desmospora activa]PTM58422.1 tripartite tricarboxylate transporter TctB family protein [Desmospora activa DSM 45169]
MTTSKIIAPLLLIAISLIVLGLSLNIKDNSVLDPTSASFFPAVVSLILMASSIAIWKRGAFSPSPNEEESVHHPDRSVNATDPIANPTTKNFQIKQLILFLIGVVSFAYLMNFIHFLLLSTVYLFLAMTFLNRSKWRSNLLISILTSSLIYFMFVSLFEIVFPS